MTVGATIAILCLVALPIRIVLYNHRDWLWSLPFMLIPIFIWRGSRWGYGISKFLIGLLAVLFAGNAVNVWALEDLDLAHKPYTPWIVSMVLLTTIMVVLFYCLQEHLRMRNVNRQ